MSASSPPLAPGCPVRTALDLLAGKWRLLLVQSLAAGPRRYGELRERLPGISEKVLTQELKHLAVAALVTRHSYGEVPPRVEYALTPAGQQALPVLSALQEFGLAYAAAR